MHPLFHYINQYAVISEEGIIKLRSECPAFNELTMKLDEQNTISNQKE